MRIGPLNITFRTAPQARNESAEKISQKKKQAIIDRVQKQTFTRIRASVIRWQNARQAAESELTPNNTELMRVYKDIEIDAHLSALMQTVRLKVIANKFAVYDDLGELDEDATSLFQKKWFRVVSREIVDAKFYGFSLVQLGNIIGGAFEGAELVPREYVVQQRGGVKRSLSNAADLMSFDDRKYKNWLVPVGKASDLGLLDKAAPLVIKKKEVVSAWSEAAELFGIPLRIGKTDINNTESRENMEDMLENMGEAAWGVFDTEDSIELISTSKTDISNMYDKFIDRINSELSKLILLQTGSTDEKAHVGAANVHENTLKDLIEAYILDVEDVANEVIIPICERQGIIKLGRYLKADNEQKFTPRELFDVVKELLSFYDIPEDWINETFEVPVEKKETPAPLAGPNKDGKPSPEGKVPVNVKNALTDPDATITDVMKAVSKLYERKNAE